MPTYVFKCESCDHEFSVKTSWSQKGETRCPECGEDSLKEMFGRYTLSVVGNGGGSAPACAPGGG